MESKKYNITLAHLMKFLIGFSLGTMYLSGYIITIGSGFHFGNEIFSVMLLALAFCFIVEYLLEISSGYRADMFGEKLTLCFATIFRILFALLILASVGLATPSPTFFVFLVFAAYAMYAAGYTLMSGNFEEWLQKQCDESNSLKTFSRNYAWMYIGLTIGLALSIVLLPSYQYQYLFYDVSIVYGIAIAANIIVIGIIFFMRDTKGFTFSDIGRFCKSYFKFSFKTDQETKDNINAVREELHQQKGLNKVFWVQATLYGIDIAYEALIPIYIFATQNFSTAQKFILIIVCYLLPNVIGSLMSSKKQQDTNADSLRQISKETYMFFVMSIMVAIVSIFPFSSNAVWYMDPVFLAFGLTIILFQIVTGRVCPHFYDYCSKLARQHSELPKTLLSIGERRKKVGAVLSLVISATAAIFNVQEAYFWVIAVMACGGIVYSYFVFREINPKETSEAVMNNN